MRIVIFDPNGWKFTTDLIREWEKDNVVQTDRYYDPELVKWADIVWFETCDNNLHQATKAAGEGCKLFEMPKKKIICRVIDIEAWCGLHRNVDWSQVDDVIFIAPHIQELVQRDITFEAYGTNVHLVPPGVDMDKFTLRKDLTKKIAWVAHRWDAKGIDYFLQYATMLYKVAPDYKIFAVGSWSPGLQSGWYIEYINQFLRENKMNVEFIDRVEDMNEFLEDKSHCICFSKKEAFSYSIAEGMCKGLKPIIHNFYGCNAIWPKRYVWNTIDEAIEMTLGDYCPEAYRHDVAQYSLDKMMYQFNLIKEVK